MPQAVPFLIAAGKAIVEAAIYAAISYGVSEAFGLNDVPTPESGKQPIKQPTPPKQKAYGEGRLSGPYLFWETVGGYTLDVIALAKGPVDSISNYYLNDDLVVMDGNIVVRGSDGRYRREGAENDTITILNRLGSTPSPYYSEVAALSGGLWTAAHRADATATIAVITRGVKAELTQTIYPNGPVQASAVGRWAKVYDWRLDSTMPGGAGAQRREDPSTWTWSNNPVVCLVHDEWFERGHDFNYRFLPTLAQATVAANICDELVPLKAGGTVKRYTMFGFYQASNAPKDLRLRFLSTFDGLMIERGDGAFVIIAGKYTAPTVILNEDRIRQFRWSRARRREDICNTLVLSFNAPDLAYTMVETEPWRDAASVAAIGEYTQPLAVPWVTENSQIRRLGKAVFSRLNRDYEGQLTVDLSEDESELEQRYFRVKNRLAPASMWDVVVEVVSMTIDLVNRQVHLEVIRANPLAYDWNAATEEGDGPSLSPTAPRPGTPTPVIVSFVVDNTGGSPRVVVTIEDPGRDDYSYALRYQDTSGAEIETRLSAAADAPNLVLTSSVLPLGVSLDFSIAIVNGAGSYGAWTEPETITSSSGGGAVRPLSRSVEYPASADDNSITIVAFDAVLPGGIIVSIPAGSVTGLASGTSYGLFWDAVGGFQVEVNPATVLWATAEIIFIAWMTTSTAGVYPPPVPPPGGWGGDNQQTIEP